MTDPEFTVPEFTVRVIISGRVQGVWFRDWTRRKALALGLTGWVRNCPDGSVEALFQGELDVVDDMIEKCRCGSPLSRVADVIAFANDEENGASLQGFEIRQTLGSVET